MKYKIFILSLLLLLGCAASFAQKKKSSSQKNKKVEEVIDPAVEVPDTMLVDSLAMAEPEPPQDRIDTIYYNKTWKVINSKAFANYYRLALYPADSLAQLCYKTYYMNGDLQSEGNFIKLDERDDKASLFDGEIVNYFKNGKVSEKMFFTQGKQDGEHTVYYENGNIKEHSTLSSGMKNGILSSFTEDGKVCKLITYKDDVPSDFYIVTDMDGNYSKYDARTDKPIFETPDMEEVQTEYKNGVAWPYYNKNGLIVGASNSLAKDVGKYREIGIFVVNKSMVNVELDPAQIEVYHIKKGKKNAMELMTADDYDKKVYNNLKKVAKKQIKKKVVVTTEKESNVNANLGASVFNAGTSNTIKTFQENIIKLKELIAENRMRYAEGKLEDLGYLERTTVHPGEIVSGFLYTDDKKVEDLFVKVTIEGIVYTYEWKTVKK